MDQSASSETVDQRKNRKKPEREPKKYRNTKILPSAIESNIGFTIMLHIFLSGWEVLSDPLALTFGRFSCDQIERSRLLRLNLGSL